MAKEKFDTKYLYKFIYKTKKKDMDSTVSLQVCWLQTVHLQRMHNHLSHLNKTFQTKILVSLTQYNFLIYNIKSQGVTIAVSAWQPLYCA